MNPDSSFLKEISSFQTGHFFFAEETNLLMSKMTQNVIPNEHLPLVQLYSTESKIAHCKLGNSHFLLWDWRWVDRMTEFLKCFYFFASSGPQRASVDDNTWGRSSKYRIERVSAQFLTERLYSKNNISLRSNDQDHLYFTSNLIDISAGILKKADVNNLEFPGEDFDYVTLALNSIIPLTVDHELVHFSEFKASGIRNQLISNLDNSFMRDLESLPESLLANEFGLYDWKYLNSVEFGGSLKKSLGVLNAENTRLKEEVYADLLSVSGTIAHLLNDRDFQGSPIEDQANLIAFTYERIMLWQVGLIYFSGLEHELRLNLGLRKDSPEFIDTDLGARKYLVSILCYWTFAGHYESQPGNTLKKAVPLVMEKLNSAHSRVQAFMTVLSQVGRNFSNYLPQLTEKRIAGTKERNDEMILDLNLFPQNSTHNRE